MRGEIAKRRDHRGKNAEEQQADFLNGLERERVGGEYIPSGHRKADTGHQKLECRPDRQPVYAELLVQDRVLINTPRTIMQGSTIPDVPLIITRTGAGSTRPIRRSTNKLGARNLPPEARMADSAGADQ